MTSRSPVSFRLIFVAACIGIITGTIAALFRLTLENLHKGRQVFAHDLSQWGIGGWAIFVLVAILMGAFGVWIAKRFAPETSGSGIQQIEGVLHSKERLRWKRILPIKFLGSLSTIGSGMLLGREGPTVQMGGAIAEGFSKWGTPIQRASLIAAGAAAGLAAAFNAPLAGFLFMLEELKRKLTVETMIAGFVACALADTIQQIIIGPEPVMEMTVNPVPAFTSLPWMIAIGLVAGLCAVPFNKGLLLSLSLFDRMKSIPWSIKGGVVAGTVAAVGWFFPHMLGEGHTVVETVLYTSPAVSFLLLILVLRFVFLLACYGSGAPGGIFSPLLSIGCILGILIYEGISATGLSPIASRQAFVVVAMAAFFTAIVRAPLTGIIMIVEMTRQDTLLLPLIFATGTAYVVAELLRLEPIYDALLKRANQNTS